MQAFIVAFTCFAALLSISAAATDEVPEREYKQVTELPSDIPTCSEKDVNLNDCIKAAFQYMMPRMRDGVKELNIRPIDPFSIPKSSYEFTSGIVQGRISMRDVQIFGLSEGIVEKVNFNLQDGHMQMEVVVKITKMLIEGSYKADMKINDIKMTPKGYFNVSMTDVIMTAKPEGELYERDGHTYLRMTKFDALPEVGDMHIYASGLLPDPELNKFILDFVNQYWQQIYKAMLPESRKTWEPIVLKTSNDFLAALPFDLLLTKN